MKALACLLAWARASIVSILQVSAQPPRTRLAWRKRGKLRSRGSSKLSRPFPRPQRKAGKRMGTAIAALLTRSQSPNRDSLQGAHLTSLTRRRRCSRQLRQERTHKRSSKSITKTRITLKRQRKIAISCFNSSTYPQFERSSSRSNQSTKRPCWIPSSAHKHKEVYRITPLSALYSQTRTRKQLCLEAALHL